MKFINRNINITIGNEYGFCWFENSGVCFKLDMLQVGGFKMTINKSVNGDVLEISLEGRLDTITAPELEGSVKDDLNNVSKCVIDLAKLEYVSSAGLRVLLTMHKAMAAKDGLIVKSANETVSEVFEVTGFSDILTIED